MQRCAPSSLVAWGVAHSLGCPVLADVAAFGAPGGLACICIAEGRFLARLSVKGVVCALMEGVERTYQVTEGCVPYGSAWVHSWP